jgi:O-antigen/teichoic acid export membrane protein
VVGRFRDTQAADLKVSVAPMSRLSKNILLNVLGQGLSLLVGFMAVRFVFRGLGGDALGLIYFNQSVSVAFMLALELGICKTTVREVASHHSDDPLYIRQLIGTATSLYWSAYVALAGFAYLAAPVLIRHWVRLESLDQLAATRVMRILMLGTLLSLPRGLYDSLLLGLERMTHANILRVGSAAAQQLGIFLVLLLHGGLLSVAYWIVVCCLAGLVAYLVVCARFFSWRSLLPGFNLRVVRQNRTFSAHVFAISVSGWFLGETDKFVISRLLPLGVMGSYTVAKSAAGRCSMLTVAINEATYPHLSALFKANNIESFRARYRALQELVCLAILPVYAAIPFLSPPVFSFLFAPPTARMLMLPVAILTGANYLYATITIPSVAALAAGKPDLVARLNYVAGLAVVLGYIAFIRLFGLAGAGLGWALYPLIAYAYFVPRCCRECLGVSVRAWYAQVGKVLSLAGATYGLAWAILCFRGALAPARLISAYLLATSAFLLAAYLTMTAELRSSLWRIPAMSSLRRVIMGRSPTRADESPCHPEPSEGSAVPVRGEPMQILRFAQNDRFSGERR